MLDHDTTIMTRHNSTEPPYHDFSRIRPLLGFERWAYITRIRITRIISPKSKRPDFGFAAFRLDSTRFVKFGSRVRLAEAQTLNFIAKNTTIPVPRVLDIFTFNGVNNLVEKFIDGPVLEDIWSQLTNEDQLSCMRELKGYLDQLRALPPPDPERVQSIDGSGCQDVRLKSDGLWGPFATHHDLQAYFGYDLIRNTPDTFKEFCEPLAKIQGRKWRSVFSHGDLGPHNILWNLKEKRIAAIIDWECSGWLPEYWEYCRAGSAPAALRPSWWDLFNEVMDTYPDEFAVEQLLDNRFSRF